MSVTTAGGGERPQSLQSDRPSGRAVPEGTQTFELKGMGTRFAQCSVVQPVLHPLSERSTSAAGNSIAGRKNCTRAATLVQRKRQHTS
jgi:hypothetical protein